MNETKSRTKPHLITVTDPAGNKRDYLISELELKHMRASLNRIGYDKAFVRLKCIDPIGYKFIDILDKTQEGIFIRCPDCTGDLRLKKKVYSDKTFFHGGCADCKARFFTLETHGITFLFNHEGGKP